MDQPESSHAQETDESDSDSSCLDTCRRSMGKHKEVVVPYADLRWSLEDFINTSFTKYENNDVTLRKFQRILDLFNIDHNTNMRRILENLKEVQDAVKEDPMLNKKVLCIESTQAALQSDISSLKQDTLNFKSMMTEIFNAFKGQSSLTPSRSVPTTTLAILKVQQLLEENITHTATKEPPSHTEGENDDIPLMRINPELEAMTSPSKIKLTDTVLEFPTFHDDVEIRLIRSLRPQPTIITPPKVQPTGSIISISQPKSSQRTDKRKRIATDDTVEPTNKLVPHFNKEEKLKKAAEEAKLLAMTKSELIKVVHEEALKAGIDLKTLRSAKGGQEFKRYRMGTCKKSATILLTYAEYFTQTILSEVEYTTSP
ncbi:hypothetical protein Tco_1500089, partial [Tanacetum coccineum]